MTRRYLVIFTAGLFSIVGCNPKPTAAPSDSEKPARVTLDEVKRDAVTSLETAATYSQQNKEQLMKDLKDQMSVMDAKIEEFRIKGANLASDAKATWELKMSELDSRRKAAGTKLEEIENSTAQAWGDVEKGARTAWEELNKAIQSASEEF
jgi:hypothetical protein